KHVSFDNGSLVRNNTVAGPRGLGRFLGVGPAATSTPLSSQRRTFSPPPGGTDLRNLLDGFVTARPPLNSAIDPHQVASQYEISGYQRM
ncbi:RNase H domain-containing protein, partial [Caerostris extrusa]